MIIKIFTFLFFLSRFNSRANDNVCHQKRRSLFVTSICSRTRLSIYRLPPFLTAKADAKITPFILTFQIFFTIFFELFFQPPRSTPPGPFHLATPPESGCKDKATLSPFPNFLSHFLQEKIKREAIILRMNRLKKKKLTRFHARGKSRIDRFE